MHIHRPGRDHRAIRRQRAGFTLIEITMAIGIVAFALVAVLGSLPVGLQTIQDAQAQEVAGSIAQETQASLQQMSFPTPSNNTGSTTTTSTVNIGNLSRLKVFYTVEGAELSSLTQSPATTTATVPTQTDIARVFYRAEFAVADPQVFGTAFGVPADPGANNSPTINCQTVTMTLRYPSTNTTPGPRSFVYSFVVARQRID